MFLQSLDSSELYKVLCMCKFVELCECGCDLLKEKSSTLMTHLEWKS